jgi:acetylornithine/succinyldiaminopimelate/putrescine aminotransferase
LHTQTFLGNPVGAAMALAALKFIDDERLVERSAALGAWLKERLSPLGRVRGEGLMLGLEAPDPLALSRALLQRGFILLPAGLRGEVLAFTPPLVITEGQLDGVVTQLQTLLGRS